MHLTARMISFLLGLTVLGTPTDGFTQSSSYKDVLLQRAISDSAEMLTRQKRFTDAISLFKSATLNVDTELSAHLHLAICFQQLGKTQKAMKEIKRAFAKGYDIKFVLNQECFSPIQSELTKHYRKLRPRYLSTIDTALRKELHEMTKADQGIRSRFMFVTKKC
jgi:tetratricopeptide (TPR) repeat protein